MKMLSIVLLTCLLLIGCQKKSTLAIGGRQIDGQFDAFINLKKHSLKTVVVDVYEDFTCPACQHFETVVAPRLKAIYGDKVTFRNHYLTGSKSPISAMVLYKTAVATGKEKGIAHELFKLGLDHQNAEKNAPLVLALAKKRDLGDQYLAAMKDTELAESIRREWNTEGANVAFFPSIVIQESIVTTGEPANLEMIFNSLLSEPKRQIRMSTMAADGEAGKMIIR